MNEKKWIWNKSLNLSDEEKKANARAVSEHFREIEESGKDLELKEDLDSQEREVILSVNKEKLENEIAILENEITKLEKDMVNADTDEEYQQKERMVQSKRRRIEEIDKKIQKIKEDLQKAGQSIRGTIN